MKHVLIAEDSKAIRSLIRIALEEAGDYFATEAANGFEALRLLPTKTFDLIITDINGLELIGFVRSNPSYKDIPLIIVSTEKTEEDKRRGLALGAFGYLVKPFKKEDLIALVSRAVKRT